MILDVHCIEGNCLVVGIDYNGNRDLEIIPLGGFDKICDLDADKQWMIINICNCIII